MNLTELHARECVRGTVARNTQDGDRGKLAELAECFTLDGKLEINRIAAVDTMAPDSFLAARWSQ
ncbi:hypothetical protein M1M07_01650 [Rhodococcus sp. HM1]|uniref:hypothetical protein n=1 Tax=Rhodococcus sp. HM1 TaxID=2937759 RepID=UPI00200B6313|nr:hypothetical protein [Rhodococcus sp. HM1]MCK8669818.1 hypothetical protein [Rhodococcus sp. HM1]